MKRLLLFGNDLSSLQGGVQRHVWDIADFMDKEGYFSTILTANLSSGLRPEIKKKYHTRSDPRLISIGDFWFGPKSVFLPGIVKYYVDVQKYVSKLVSDKRYHILHTHGVTASFPLSARALINLSF